MDRLGRLVESARRRADNLFAVLFLDLDHFKLVNDRLGHSAGDELLTKVARLLEKCIRPGDTVARLGGDEFALLLADINHSGDATGIADRILKKLESPFRVSDQEVYATASIGIAINMSGYDRPEDLLRDADIALYRAKSLGRGRRMVFDMAIHAQAIARLELESDLSRAIENDELLLVFQPIVSLDSGQVMAFEALIRWDHPKQGILLPKDFISIAEETGLILPIGDWVLRRATGQLRKWLDLDPHERSLKIHINLSGKRFGRPGLRREIESILNENGLEPRHLTLELSESVLMEDAEKAIDICHQLEALGVRVCIDDFGTGYSSLSHLHRFPTAALKIDRSFISPIGADGGNLELVRAIIALADNLRMEIIAEGIETPEQLVQLQILGCKTGQGYLFAGPLGPDAATELIQNGELGAILS
jgi:diguanylate cyclase (GGDEF)-like protein